MPDSTPPVGANALACALIRLNEGFRAAPYRDVAGVWTIGTGFTRLGGAAVTARTPPITAAQDEAALAFELERTRACLAGLVRVEVAACEWAALASFAFNVGGGALAGSTLLRRLNAGDRPGAAGQFAAWTIAGGKRAAGLVARRAREAAVFRGQPVAGVTGPAAPSAADALMAAELARLGGAA